MKYTSTRGGVRDLTFEDALFTGYATDGGILVPEEIPTVSAETLKSWGHLSFVELAKEIVSLFISEEEIPRSDLNGLLEAAFSTFSVPGIAPIARLKDGLCVLELFHGKTWAFKDLALSCVGQFYNYFCSKRKKHYTVIVAIFRYAQWEPDKMYQGQNTPDSCKQGGRNVPLQFYRMCPSCEGEIEIVIPTGACGNVTSGCYAKAMGLPIRMVCAVTRNDIVVRAIKDGDYSMVSEVFPTLAPAMDIQLPYNMERLWYIYTHGDVRLIGELMDRFETTGSVTVPKELLEKISEGIVDTYVATDTVVKETMKKVWEDNNYLVCPHTAIAVAYHYKAIRNGNNLPRICVATASIDKFREAAEEAGIPIKMNPRVAKLETMPTKYKDMNKGEDWEKILREKIVHIDSLKTKLI